MLGVGLREAFLNTDIDKLLCCLQLDCFEIYALVPGLAREEVRDEQPTLTLGHVCAFNISVVLQRR